jgi:hypothetical protein
MAKSKYNDYVKPFLGDIAKWARVGVDEQDIARKLGIAPQTFSTYKAQHDELREAVRNGRQDAVLALKNKLFERAMGECHTKNIKRYTTDDEKNGKKVHLEENIIQHPPDVAAIQILLKNWEPGWADKPGELNIRREELELKKRLAEDKDWSGIGMIGGL